MKTYRYPVANGIFYKSSKQELLVQLKEAFLNKEFGPGNLPLVKKTDQFMAFIVPHAGYDYSGFCAAHAYRKIGENTDPETIVILGPNHHSIGINASIFPEGSWLTPLGEVEIDYEFNKQLLEEKVLFIPDEFAHSEEHSIEVQLPFIRFIYKDKVPKFVPIMINEPYENKKKLEMIGDALFKAWRKSGKRILFIASSDFSHVGMNYGYIPYKERGEELNRKVKEELDREALNYIVKLDIDGFVDYLKKTKATICGASAIIVLMRILKDMKGKKVKGTLLKQYTSADLTFDFSNFVDYCSVEFK